MNYEALVKLVFGMRGCGKSEKVRKMIKDIRRQLVIDTLRKDYQDGVMFDNLTDLKRFWLSVYSGDFRIIFRPPGGDADKRIADVAEICKLCMVCGNMTLVVEEMNILFDRKKPPTEFNELIFGGRDPGIELISVAQRPVGFGRDITSQAKEVYVFTSREPDDVKYFKHNLGSDAAKDIWNLEQYHYLKWIMADGVQNYEICKDEVV